MTQSFQSRIGGLDIIRGLAILFVIGGHFFSINTPFKTTTFEGLSMFIQAIAETFLHIGVPLFIMMTGYLNSNKSVSGKYFKNGLRVIVSYLLFSVLTILFRKYYLDQSHSWTQWFLKILDFSAIPYGWYIEMWIGLFLLTPFLNLLYHNIPSKNQKKLLIIVLYLLTAIPDLLNRYGLHIVPGFWQKCYPLLFFFIGLYIREFKPVINKLIAWLVILGICLINPLFSLIVAPQSTLVHITGGSFGVFGTIIACLFFLLVYQEDIKSAIFNKIITKISLLSLDMYLCCYIFDALVYPYFIEHYYINQSQFGKYFFVIIPIVFILSFTLAWIVDLIKQIIKTK